MLCYWAKFNFCKWPNIEKIVKPSGHADTKPLSKRTSDTISTFSIARSEMIFHEFSDSSVYQEFYQLETFPNQEKVMLSFNIVKLTT